MYNFAIFAFLFLSDNYYDSSLNSGLINKSGDSLCMSLLHCFLSTLNYGLRFGGGIGELGTTTTESWNASNYYIKFFFDIAFFLLITTIILNVVFGIIIDSFAQLREE
jgi:inositol 1,4,5-triphosphate receptor type 3